MKLSETQNPYQNLKKSLRLHNNHDRTSVPKHYFYGTRKLNIILTQLRRGASFLNADLYKVNIAQSPYCRCGPQTEDVHHFFFVCPLYTDIRRDMLNEINEFMQWQNIDIILLTCGDENLTYADNCRLFDIVFNFIKKSKRFLIV